jgi:omega-amidase
VGLLIVTKNNATLTVALGEYDTGWHDPALSISRVRDLASKSRDAGAQLLVLPEMCTTGFTMDTATFAEDFDGPSIKALASIAAEHELWIVAGISMSREGKFLNSAVAFSPDGSVAGTYDKQRLFGFAEETSVYSAGDGPSVVDINGISLGLFVCFDLRFPELFREVGPDVDALVVLANWPTTRHRHWEVLTQARAIENQCYMIAVNRVGEADGLQYRGGSVVFDPWGERIDAPAKASSLRIAEISHAEVAKLRKSFPLATS